MRVNSIPSRSKVVETFSFFAVGTAGWLAALFYIELAPKSESSRDTLRLIYTFCYFLTVMGLVVHIKRTLPAFLSSLNRWRFEDAPPSMESAWKNLVEESQFVLSSFSWIIIVLTAATGVAVLSTWFHLPGVLLGANGLLWWFGVLALVAFAYWFPASLNSMFRHFRFLRRQTATCDFYRPKSISDLWTLNSNEPDRKYLLFPPKNGFIAGNRRWTFAALTQNLIAFGSIGSGKTACVMNTFLNQFVASSKLRKHSQPAGGLVLDFKGDYFDKLTRICQTHSREQDLIVLSPDGFHKWNPLDNEDTAAEIAARFVSTMKALGQKDKNTTFFESQSESFIEHAITLLRCDRNSGYPPTVSKIYRLANDSDFLSMLVSEISELADSCNDAHPVARCRMYFRNEFVTLPEDTRNSVLGTLNNMLNPLCAENVASIIDGPSTINLSEAASNSRIVYLNLPQARSPKAGRVLGLLLKLSFFAEVVKKELESGKYSFFFADEFQEFFTSDDHCSDTRFFSVSRQFDHCNLVATQNMNNLTMQGDKKDAVMSLLASIKTKIFLQNSDQQTNAYASELFGRHVEELGGGHLTGHVQVVPNLSPGDFISLKTPARGVCDHCDSYMLVESGSQVDTANRVNRWPVISL